jgi:hypothetical protein
MDIVRKIDQIVNCLLDRVILETFDCEIRFGIAKAIESMLKDDCAPVLLLSLGDDQCRAQPYYGTKNTYLSFH